VCSADLVIGLDECRRALSECATLSVGQHGVESRVDEADAVGARHETSGLVGGRDVDRESSDRCESRRESAALGGIRELEPLAERRDQLAVEYEPRLAPLALVIGWRSGEGC